MPRKTIVNKITTPEKIQQINENNKFLARDFLDYLVSIDRAASTIRQYKSDLNIFFVWNMENNSDKDFVKITKREIARFQSHALNDWKWSPKRMRRVKAAISSLSNYVENILDQEDDFKDFKSIVKKIENPPNESVRKKSIFTEDELQNVLDKLVENKEYQQACALALAISSGRRKAELCRFKVSYFTDKNIIYGAFYKTPEKIVTKGRGSRGKLLTCYVYIKKFKPYFDLWMEERKRLNFESDWLLVKKNGNTYLDEPMEATTLDYYAELFEKQLDKPFYWHSVRHFFTTYLSINNIPDSVIQALVGWDSLDMVSVYNDREVDDLLGAYFDENGIKNIEKGNLNNL